MSRKIKTVIAAFLTSAILCVTIFAANLPPQTRKTVDVWEGYTVYVDGVKFEPRDYRDNSIIESFNYDGWIYSPFEHIAVALGKQSYWDGDTRTLYLTTPSLPKYDDDYWSDYWSDYYADSYSDYWSDYYSVIEGLLGDEYKGEYNEPEAEPLTPYDSIQRDYDWYIDQGNTGSFSSDNCVPASVVMAAKWVDKNFDRTTEQIREEFIVSPIAGHSGAEGWCKCITEEFFIRYDIKHSIIEGVTAKKMTDELDKGNILLVGMDIGYISHHIDRESRYVTYSHTHSDTGHAFIVKGYKTIENKLYFEVYDPSSLGEQYKDGTPIGKDRNYLSSELVSGAQKWWGSFFVIYNPKNYD